MSRDWDEQIERLKAHARHVALSHKHNAVAGVAVDNERKRDYFVPRLQAILDTEFWAEDLTFRIVPMMGGEPIELRRRAPDQRAAGGER